MESCYLCGRDLITKIDLAKQLAPDDQPAFKHSEHIIQNALFGKLKSDTILCESCGSKLNTQIDANFCELFSVFTERLKEFLAPKDHGGSNRSKILKGYLYLDGNLNDKIKINYKDSQASPEEPYFEVDEANMIIKIYANRHRGKQYKNQVIKELQALGHDANLYSLEFITDISDKGVVDLFFSEGIDNFNENFCLGLNKIATGFAYYHGIDRSYLHRTLDTRNQRIVYTNNLIPFSPIGAFDFLTEMNRLDLEPSYPTHTLILFTHPNQHGTKTLFCYIDLFSTFQHYVILSDNYPGESINKTYYQSILKQSYPDVNIRRIKPKNLMVFMEWAEIDQRNYSGDTLSDLYDFVETEYKKLTPNYEENLADMLKEIAEQLVINFALYENKPEAMQNKRIQSGFNAIDDRNSPSLKFELENYFYQHNVSLYRTFFSEYDGQDGIEFLFTPGEVQEYLKKKPAIPDFIKSYGHEKFHEFNKFVTRVLSKVPTESEVATGHLAKLLFRQYDI